MNLSAKLGPLPAKTWIIVIGGLGVGLYVYRRAQHSNADQVVSDAATAQADTGTMPGTDSASYYAGDGSGLIQAPSAGTFSPSVPATPSPTITPPATTVQQNNCRTQLIALSNQIHKLDAQVKSLTATRAHLQHLAHVTKDKTLKARYAAQAVNVGKQIAAVRAKLAPLRAEYSALNLICAGVRVAS